MNFRPHMLKTPLLVVLLGTPVGVLSAQSDQEICVVTISGQNKGREADGFIDAECDDVFYPFQWHDPPWGNWGVDSNYGDIRDTDQFEGWKYKDGKYQWNSCTDPSYPYAPPNPDYYNINNSTAQRSSSIVTHGSYQLRTYHDCESVGVEPEPSPGCTDANGWTISESNNYMYVYELDEPDNDDYVDGLSFSSTSITLSGCDHDGCPERRTGWVSASSSVISASLRMKASATLYGYCDVDW